MREHVRIWRYEVPPEQEQAFLHHYATDGTWAQLFRQAAGYLGTTLWQDANGARRFYTQDRWRSEEDFEKFNRQFADAYAELDRRLESMATKEEFIGAMNRVE